MITAEMRSMMLRDQMSNDIEALKMELAELRTIVNIQTQCIALKADKESLEEVREAIRERSRY